MHTNTLDDTFVCHNMRLIISRMWNFEIWSTTTKKIAIDRVNWNENRKKKKRKEKTRKTKRHKWQQNNFQLSRKIDFWEGKNVCWKIVYLFFCLKRSQLELRRIKYILWSKSICFDLNSVFFSSLLTNSSSSEYIPSFVILY